MKKQAKVVIAIIALSVACGGAIGYYRDRHETALIEYRVTVDSGDTLWGICGRIATDKEDMGRLVWQTMQDNHIDDPGNLQPGQEIVVRVKEAREL